MELKINDKTYKIAFGFNSFCDTDLMDRTEQMISMIADEKLESDDDIRRFGKITDMFKIVRELIFVGMEKYNPVSDIKEVGDLLDIYHEEGTAEEPHGLFELFALLTNELLAKGFFGDVVDVVNKAAKNLPKRVKKN